MIIATPPSLSLSVRLSGCLSFGGLLRELVKLVSQSPNPEDLEAREFYLGASTSEYGTPWETWRAVRFFSLSLSLWLATFFHVRANVRHLHEQSKASGRAIRFVSVGVAWLVAFFSIE